MFFLDMTPGSLLLFHGAFCTGGFIMPLNEFASQLRVVGEREVRRALRAKRLKKLFVARDGELERIKDVMSEAERQGISVEWADDKVRLGRACAISRSALVAGITDATSFSEGVGSK